MVSRYILKSLVFILGLFPTVGFSQSAIEIDFDQAEVVEAHNPYETDETFQLPENASQELRSRHQDLMATYKGFQESTTKLVKALPEHDQASEDEIKKLNQLADQYQAKIIEINQAEAEFIQQKFVDNENKWQHLAETSEETATITTDEAVVAK